MISYCFVVILTNTSLYALVSARLPIALLVGLVLLFPPAALQAQVESGKAKVAEDGGKAETPEGVGEANAVKASVKKLGDHRYQLGEITFDGKTREIRFPAVMNMEKGLLEYMIVTGDGKIHESLLSTEISASQLQVVMKLCRYKDGVGDIFDALFPENEKEGKAGEAKRGSSVRIAVEWTEKSDGIEKPRRYQLAELISDLKTDGPVPKGQWIYTGSMVYEGTFIAAAEGTLVAMYIDNGALINSFRPGSDDDERWITNAEVAPKIGTPTTVILTPDTAEFPLKK